MHTPEKPSLAPVSSPDEGNQSRTIRTNIIQGITAVAIHARRAHIHRPIEVEVLAVANSRALHIPTRRIRLDEAGQHFTGAGRRSTRLIETAHW